MSRLEATFYGDTEDEARAQFEDWRASETRVEITLTEFGRDSARPWTWHAVVEMADRVQLDLAL